MASLTGVDIVEFLAAMLDEDERVAREATGDPWVIGRYQYSRVGDVYAIDPASGTPALVAHGHACGPDVSAAQTSTHIARHDPARVLAEVAAKRVILAEHRPVRFTDATLGLRDVEVCWVCHGRLDEPDDWDEATSGDWPYPEVQLTYPCRTVRALAQPYADHPDYDPAWRVTERAAP